MDKVEFVSYDGAYPNLCSGILTIKVNGKVYTFGDYGNKESFDKFWSSGGSVFCLGEDEIVAHGPWKYDFSGKYPDEVIRNIERIKKLFSENVPTGCCGGCI